MAEDTLACPYCQAELAIGEQDGLCTCGQCGRELQAPAQRAFARGRSSFEEGQACLEAALERKRRPLYERDNTAALRSLQRAHSALMEAFRYELPDAQREHAVEMMAEISRVFAQRGIISPSETSYWARVALEQNCLRELDALRAGLASSGRGVWEWLAGVHRRLRRRQLTSALARIEAQLALLEQIIAFADPPHARRPRDRRLG